MKRFFNLLLGALAMLAVALISAFITMRLAIHGREVEVPSLAGLSMADAGKKAGSLVLRLNLEDRFYSASVPSGHILAQSPAPGVAVRREWAVRVTESLGPQRVSIPNVVGQSERTASINIRRLALEVGTIARIAGPGEAGIVLAQTPDPNAAGVDRPRVSLLISQSEDEQTAPAFVMPSLAGLTMSSAMARAAASGLHVVSIEDANTPAPAIASTAPTTAATPAQPAATPQAASIVGTVSAQTPLAGHRVIKGEAVHLILTY
jgi:beta-lactam-binding protein with PASTA domain